MIDGQDGQFCGCAAIRATQHQLYRDRERWARQRFVYSQGRTLGIVGIGLHTVESRLREVRRVPRVLLHGWSEAARRSVLDRLDLPAGKPPLDLQVFARATGRRGEVTHGAPLAGRLDAGNTRWVAAAQSLQEASGIVPVPGWILSGRDGRTVSLGIVADGELRAVACVQRVPALLHRDNAALLFGVAVDTACRARGYGTALLRAATDAASQMGAGWLCELVEPGNHAAAALAAKEGFIRRETDWALFVERHLRRRRSAPVGAGGAIPDVVAWRSSR